MKTQLLIGTLVLICLLCAIGFGFTGYLYLTSTPQVAVTPSPTPLPTGDELSITKQQVARHIVLPNEEPKLVTVTDVDLLKKEQAFFESAQNGDKLLVYPTKVILYNPTLDRVIDIAHIRPDGTTPVGQ